MPPLTTANHLQDVRETLQRIRAPLELVREFEDMEKHGLTIAVPYQYKQKLNKKNAWGRNALIAAAVCGGCGIMALHLGRIQTGRLSGHLAMTWTAKSE